MAITDGGEGKGSVMKITGPIAQTVIDMIWGRYPEANNSRNGNLRYSKKDFRATESHYRVSKITSPGTSINDQLK